MSRALASRSLRTIAAVAGIAASLAFTGCSELLSRDDFTARVQNKSETEVAKSIGKPAAVDASSPDQVKWTYNSRTFNIEAGNKFDSKAVVVFSKTGDQLRATEIKFE